MKIGIIGKKIIDLTNEIGKDIIAKPLKINTAKMQLPLQTDAVQLSNHIGKHKIPRYLYHMTNEANYNSILSDGVIKTSKDDMFGSGIFTTELTNLFKRWRSDKAWGDLSLQEELIKYVSKGSNNIVILRIPTKILNPDLLKIRSQNKLFSYYNSEEVLELANIAKKELKAMHNVEHNWVDELIAIFKKHLLNSNCSLHTHLAEGAPAKYSSLYKQKKEALEYIYTEAIPITNVEKIGEVNIHELRLSQFYDPTKPMRSIFTSLLKGTPEVKGAELLNC